MIPLPQPFLRHWVAMIAITGGDRFANFGIGGKAVNIAT